MYSRDVSLDHVVLVALPLCLARSDIAHVRIFVTGHWLSTT